MKINLNMKSCEKCGIYLNLGKVEKSLLTIKYKERFVGERISYNYVYIRGFYCPFCQELHINNDYNGLSFAIEDDSCGDIDEEEFIKKKLGITDRYRNINFYGDEDED